MSTLPPATIPEGFTGTWTPPSQYGKLLSPTIVLTESDWPVGGPPGAKIPQFATDLGQQIGQEFFFYGVFVVPNGLPNTSPAAGYLGNNYKQGSLYGAPVGSSMVYESNVESSWAPIQGQPFVVTNPPTSKAQVNDYLNQAIALINKALQS